MNDKIDLDRYDTGILSLADLFRRDRLPCLAAPKRRFAAGSESSAPRSAEAREAGPASGLHSPS